MFRSFDRQGFVFLKAAGGFADNCKRFRKDFFQDNFQLLIALLDQLVDLGEVIFFLVEVVRFSGRCVKMVHFFVYLAEKLGDALFELHGFVAEFVVGYRRKGFADAVNFFDEGQVGANVSFVLRAE